MKINLSIPDELFETYVKKFGLPAAYNRMRQAIEIFKDVEVSDRAIVVAADNRRAIEAIFQTTIDDAPKLVKLIQNMNTIKLGNVEMGFTAEEYARLQMQATFHGRTLETFVREMVMELKDMMLEKV